jgi:hypothetical protein
MPSSIVSSGHLLMPGASACRSRSDVLARPAGSAWRAGMVTQFSDSRLQFDTDDPPVHRKSRERVVLPLEREKLIQAHYRPFRTLLAQSRAAEIERVRY